MIAIIHVTLTQGELQSKNHLQGIAASIYPQDAPPAPDSHRGLQSYVADMAEYSVYVCVPRPASQALFLWLDSREFEIIIETAHGGHLLRIAEGVVRGVIRKLVHMDMNPQLEIFLQSPGDAQTYMTGKPTALLEDLGSGLRSNGVAILVAIILVIVAKVWLVDYFQEAIASLISISLLSVWQAVVIWNRARSKPVNWRIHD